MLHKTEGIVLRAIPYGETSMICTMFTLQFGRQSYLINGARSAKSKTRALLQPLTLLDLVVYKRGNRNLERIKELKPLQLYHSIPFDRLKRSIGLFMSELIYKSIVEENTDEELFVFLKNTLLSLDSAPVTAPDYPIRFMLELTKYLGFYPQSGYEISNSFFDMQHGSFSSQAPMHLNYLHGTLSGLFGKFISEEDFVPKSAERKQLLHVLENYYRLHIPGFNGLASPAILEVVL